MPNDVAEASHSTENHLGYLLRRVSALAMNSLATDLQPLELRVTEVTVLHQIAEAPNITASEIGRTLEIRRANMTPLISGLLQKGYLTITAKDGRSQALALSSAGRKIYQKAWGIVEDHEQGFFSTLSGNERQVLSGILVRLWKQHSSKY